MNMELLVLVGVKMGLQTVWEVVALQALKIESLCVGMPVEILWGMETVKGQIQEHFLRIKGWLAPSPSPMKTKTPL